MMMKLIMMVETSLIERVDGYFKLKNSNMMHDQGQEGSLFMTRLFPSSTDRAVDSQSPCLLIYRVTIIFEPPVSSISRIIPGFW